MATTSTFGTTARKPIARLAMIGLDANTGEILRDCFRQFGVSTTPVVDDPSHRFLKEKFEACVLRLDDGAEPVLEQIRNSPSNRRIVIYGIAQGTQAAMRYSRYGINAVFEEPLDRPSVLKVVRSTHLLVINELRRYVRVPIVTEASIEAQDKRIASSTLEVSAGGMSLICSSKLHLGHSVQIAFALPILNGGNLKVRASVCWARENENAYGVRFDATDDRRLQVKRWIDEYLQI
jgi:PilZ domain-containing protein